MIKRVVGLRDKKNRDRQGVFLIEGAREILRAFSNGISFEALIYCPEIAAEQERRKVVEIIEDRSAGNGGDRIQLIAISSLVFSRIAYREKVGGLLALAHVPTHQIDKLTLSTNPLIVVIHDIEKPGNLGALLRSADGAGVDALIVAGSSGVDLYNPNVVRSSLGALFTVKTFVLSLDRTLEWLKANRIKVVLSSPVAKRFYTDVDYTGPVAIVLGSEKEGLSRQCLEKAGVCRVKIPMRGQMDSLNVSCSGAIILFEAVRQRMS